MSPQRRQAVRVLGLISTAFFIVALIFLIRALDKGQQAAQQIGTSAQQAQQAISTAEQQITTAEQKAQQAAQPAEGSSCSNPPGGGKGVIAIEGPTAANPGTAECIPQ